jgi:hypothetical protein
MLLKHDIPSVSDLTGSHTCLAPRGRLGFTSVYLCARISGGILRFSSMVLSTMPVLTTKSNGSLPPTRLAPLTRKPGGKEASQDIGYGDICTCDLPEEMADVKEVLLDEEAMHFVWGKLPNGMYYPLNQDKTHHYVTRKENTFSYRHWLCSEGGTQDKARVLSTLFRKVLLTT